MADVSRAGPAEQRPVRRVEQGRLLRHAARDVADVLPALNTNHATCDCCGRRQDKNFTEAEIFRRLSRVKKDLNYLADLLESGRDILEDRISRKTLNKGGMQHD